MVGCRIRIHISTASQVSNYAFPNQVLIISNPARVKFLRTRIELVDIVQFNMNITSQRGESCIVKAPGESSTLEFEISTFVGI